MREPARNGDILAGILNVSDFRVRLQLRIVVALFISEDCMYFTGCKTMCHQG